jgi:predicted ATPase/uncharacterized protein YktA (UPF0223 family)
MELLYVWIKDFGNVKDCGFNFGGEFLFDYKEKTKDLTYEKNPDYIEGFFNLDGNSIINNITGIVGKNGAGKSTLINFLIPRLCSGVHEEAIPDCVAVLKKGGEIQIVSSKEYANFKERYTKIDTYGVRYQTSFESLSNLSLIYYNPGWHDTIHYSLSGLDAINTRALIEKEDPKLHKNNNANGTNISLNEAINIHELQEGIRKVNFLKAKDTFDFNMDFPDYLVVHLKKVGVSEEKSKQEGIRALDKSKEGGANFEHYYYIWANFFDKVEESTSIKTDLDYFKLLLYRSMLFHSVQDAGRDPAYLVDKIKNFDFSQDVLEGIKKIMLEAFSQQEFRDFGEHKDVSLPFPNDQKYANRISYVIDELDDFLKIYSPSEGNSGSINLFIDVQKDSEKIKNFLKVYFSTIVLTTQYLYFDFSHSKEAKTILSTGEERYLSMVSRFYSLTDQEIFGDKLKKDVLVFMDETELYFHPEWQQAFIKLLVDFLPKIYGKERAIQIVLTSHSPFIISDLPNHNVIFLQSKEDGTCEVLPSGSMRSFSANIHHLFKDAFFMGRGLMGSFAEAKINSVINWLNLIEVFDEDITKSKKYQEIKRFIEIVDEPIIKQQLLIMFAKKIGNDNKYQVQELFNEQVERLRKQMGLEDDKNTRN